MRFGDENLHFCDVMIKDIADSKRINARIMDDFKKEGIIAVRLLGLCRGTDIEEEWLEIV